jgi:guanine deaminase
MKTPSRIALRGDLLDFTADPGLSQPHNSTAQGAVRWRPDHWLMVEDGRIVDAQPVASLQPGEDWKRVEHPGRWIVPGFIDTHVHSAQVDVIGSWGSELLDWLTTHTYPAEQRLADPVFALQNSQLFVHALLSHGTTTACVFPTVHAASCEALYETAKAKGMRMIAGKVLMDRHAPEALLDENPQKTAQISVDLIERWHGQGRVAVAITPRFAATSSPQQLQQAAELMRLAPDLYLQTHVAENRAEIDWVAQLYPEARSYLDVYDRHGLLGPRSILAHGIWLDDADRAALHKAGAQIAFCPSSNLFLGSGLFDWAQARESGVAVTLASDVGGGTHLSMRRTMLAAYQVQALRASRVSAWALLHAATRGAAQALHLADEIGSLQPGCLADITIWDRAVHPLSQRRQAVARDLHEQVFAWVTSGDENDLVETWVAGVRQFVRLD